MDYVCPPDTQKIKFVAIVVAVSCCLSLLLLLLLTLSADISMLQDGRAPNAAPARKHCPFTARKKMDGVLEGTKNPVSRPDPFQ